MTAHCNGEDVILPIHFFKIILKSNLERLKIPDKFTRKYGSGLSNPLLIKPPDGTEWMMYWTEKNGEVWFENGWKEFVENYSLDHGHLVFFKYEGTSQIDVLILDQSATEIDYLSCDIFEENDNHEQSDDESVEILDEWPCQNAIQISGENATQRTKSLNRPRESRAQELARKFISCNPFFTVCIKPYNLAQSKLSVPAHFKSYMEKKDKYVRLQVGERSWSVKMLTCFNPSSRLLLCAGWPLFARENELQPGNICIFELISTQYSVFKVHVFKSQS